MRSISHTLLLLAICLLFGGAASWQWMHGDFHALLGAPAVPAGQRLYPDFDPSDIREIEIGSALMDARFVKQPNGWQAVTPWQDRMAPEAAIGIIQFVAGLKAEDHADRDDMDPEKSGMGKNSIRIRLRDAQGRSKADFRIGRAAPWKVEVPDWDQPVATVYVQKLERHHKQYIYIGSGDIGPLFKDGFKFLRDHQPFYFHPALLRSIRIRSEGGELTLAREDASAPWRVIKPLDLPTDVATMKALIDGLLSLRATRLSERAEVSLSASLDEAKSTQIALSTFGGPGESVLDILPPESPDAREVKATVSDRPKVVFHLPHKPEAGLVTLANLPLSVNELRDPALTHLNMASLRGVSIQPATAPEVLLTRDGKQPWMVTMDGKTQLANEENLFGLLKAVTGARALAFESDAVTDFVPYGLDRPLLVLRFLGEDNQAFELRFGMDAKGNLFANRLGTSSVMRVERGLLDAMPIRSHEWRHSRLWSLHRINLLGMERMHDGRSLELKYDNTAETWQASGSGVNVTGDLNTDRANYLLGVLEDLRVSRWLEPGDIEAAEALARPTLAFRIFTQQCDDEGNVISRIEDRLEFAAMPGPHAAYYYGRRLAEPHFFLIARETYDKLALDLLD